MRYLSITMVIASFVVLSLGAAHAQSPTQQHQHPSSPPAGAPPPSGAPPEPGAPPPGPHGGGTMGSGHGAMKGGGHGAMMTCPMMSGGSMPMTGMMRGGPMDEGSGAPADPKAMGRMLQMRGEMMKAMADIMIKHGRDMEAAKP